MNYNFLINREEDKVTFCDCIELSDFCVIIDSSEDFEKQVEVKLNDHIRNMLDQDKAIKLPLNVEVSNKKILSVPVHDELIFPLVLKSIRLTFGRSQEVMAFQLGLESKEEYQKLESNPNPSFLEIKHILEVFPIFPYYLLF